ncbi:MAG TPA: LysM domain-containing protein, partial [Aggregatilineales bacterium]|nr:LysM domain-containing protein [Aggregatilineales bacterium]
MLLVNPTQAQDETSIPPLIPTESPDPGGMVIHVVQRNETLSEIAQTYGTTIESLMVVNSLADPDKLQVGQRVIIPVSGVSTLGLLETHMVEPGETLYTIAERYNSTPDSLSQVNNIPSADSLYVGQNIMVTLGANGELPPERSSMHIVQPGENVLRIAVKYRISLFDLINTNHRTFT